MPSLKNSARIQELEDEIQDLKHHLNELKSRASVTLTASDAQVIKTQNAALSRNLKKAESKIHELEQRNNELTWKLLQSKTSKANPEDASEKLLYYQKRWTEQDKKLIAYQKQISKLFKYLEKVGISFDELKKACKTGVLTIGKLTN